MSVQMTVRNSTVTKGMKRYAEEKAERLSRFFDGITSIEVILDVEGLSQTAEIVLAIAHSDGIVVTADHEQMNAAIDLAIDRAERSVVKHKEKLRDHRPNNNAVPPPAREPGPDDGLESYQDIIEKTEFPK